jgi:hypothetical protein
MMKKPMKMPKEKEMPMKGKEKKMHDKMAKEMKQKKNGKGC